MPEQFIKRLDGMPLTGRQNGIETEANRAPTGAFIERRYTVNKSMQQLKRDGKKQYVPPFPSDENITVEHMEGSGIKLKTPAGIFIIGLDTANRVHLSAWHGQLIIEPEATNRVRIRETK